MGVPTPTYGLHTVTNWAVDGQQITLPGSPPIQTGLVIYHTPGLTPDSLVVWDAASRLLFVGDTLLDGVTMVFPPGAGDLRVYVETLTKLATLLRGWNGEAAAGGRRVKIACGHTVTAVGDADAEELVARAADFFSLVRRGHVPPTHPRRENTLRGWCRAQRVQGPLQATNTGGEQQYGAGLGEFQRENSRISFMCPKAMFEKWMVGGNPA